jgi:hypothetical protein
MERALAEDRRHEHARWAAALRTMYPLVPAEFGAGSI